MRTKYQIATLVACMLLAVSLGGTGLGHDYLNPGFDPAPWVMAFSPERQTVVENIVEQSFDQDWTNSYRYSAEYDSYGRLSVQRNQVWNEETQSWLNNYTVSAVYRPDNRLQRVDLSVLSDGVWQPYGVVDYLYGDNLLRSIRYDIFTEGVREPWWQAAFYYMPSTLILDKVVEIYYFDSPAPGTMRRFEYIWDAGSRPSEIIESVMDSMNDWYVQTRHTYVYHNDDQTTQASYMKMLQYGWVFIDRLVSGIQPTKLLEHRRYDSVSGSNNWVELLRSFYVYDNNNQLLSVDTYDERGSGEWEVNWQTTYDYENGLPVTETFWQDDDGEDILSSYYRFLYDYTQITDADDPVSTPQLNKLLVYPNPFNPQTGISYKLQTAIHTEVSVYNLKGQKVRTLYSGSASGGDHNLTWNGKDDQGRDLAAGIYLIRLQAGKQSSIVKAVLQK